jgi:hypothetical protein
MENIVSSLAKYEDPIIGADEQSVKELLFNCDPYRQNCLLGNSGRYNYTFALITQWFVSLFTVWFQWVEFRDHVVPEAKFKMIDVLPLVKAEGKLGVHLLLWLIQFLFVAGSSAYIVLIGLICNIF